MQCFVVQSFNVHRKGSVTADMPILFSDEGTARRAAYRLSSRKPGVIMIRQDVDDLGEILKASMICVHGDVPEAAVEMMCLS